MVDEIVMQLHLKVERPDGAEVAADFRNRVRFAVSEIAASIAPDFEVLFG